MSEFLALHVYGLCRMRRAAPLSFIRFVNQLLHATRLPLATILLGLVYLQHRASVGKVGRRWLDTLCEDENSPFTTITSMFAISNKFLDDNTFTNKSWSDVTRLPVSVITELELEWLRDISFTLSPQTIDGESKHAGWRKLWNGFVAHAQHRPERIDTFAIAAQRLLDGTQFYPSHGYMTPVTSHPSPIFSLSEHHFGDARFHWYEHIGSPRSSVSLSATTFHGQHIFHSNHQTINDPTAFWHHEPSRCMCSLCHAHLPSLMLGF
ncbi:hypothetical protein PYCC9005_000769 [Savitreella phatthalungensis]